jgi:integrase
VVWDALQRGLAIRVQPTGACAWKCVYSRQGQPRWLHLGNTDTIGLAEARTLAAEALLAVARGKDPAAEKKAERGAGTFGELSTRYVETYAKRRNKSWRQADTLVQRYLAPRWGKLSANLITRGRRPPAPVPDRRANIANQILAAASAIFGWAVKEELVPVNPCPRHRAQRHADSRTHPLRIRAAKVLAGLRRRGAGRGSALKVILLLTGQRPGEVAHMRREHIVDGWWEMPGAPVPALGWPGTKNGSAHRVWLPAPVQAILAELDGGGFIFAAPAGAPIGGLDGAMRAICTRLETERATPHDLRRTHGSTVTALGFGRDAMNRVQNHREGGIASVYDRHGYADENKRMMEAVAARIMALVEGRPATNVVSIKR